MSARDAIDVLLGLRTGDAFRLRGRTFWIEGTRGWSHYADYSLVPVWNKANRAIRIKVRPSDVIEVLQ